MDPLKIYYYYYYYSIHIQYIYKTVNKNKYAIHIKYIFSISKTMAIKSLKANEGISVEMENERIKCKHDLF